MADISISLNNIQNIKLVNIEGVGDLTVRRLGAGEELDLSTKQRRLLKLLDELEKVDQSKFDTTKPEELKKLTKLTRRLDVITDEISEIKKFEFNTYKRCLSDNKNGEIVDLIMNTLTDEERAKLFVEIFGNKKEVTAPDAVTPDESVGKESEAES